jgi:hypothetical protein
VVVTAAVAAAVVAARADTVAVAVVAAETVAIVAAANAVTDRPPLISTEEQPSPQREAAFSFEDRSPGSRLASRTLQRSSGMRGLVIRKRPEFPTRQISGSVGHFELVKATSSKATEAPCTTKR